MQQTERYKLNLIESSDPFLPDGLNQNTWKVEEVLAAREAINDQKLAEMNGRVTALEAHRFFTGTYEGDGATTRFVYLGFTPLAIFVGVGLYFYFASAGHGCNALTIVEGGIQINSIDMYATNSVGTHPYFAFV